MAAELRYMAVVAADARKRVVIPVPFDPDETWGAKREHRVAGSVNGMSVRGSLEPFDGGHAIVLGPSWRQFCHLGPGDEVSVVLYPEGPQRADLAPDLAAAFDAEPEAGAFFDSLAQFYRRAYLRWIDATTRRPDVRVARIAEVVALCKAGVKERPKPAKD